MTTLAQALDGGELCHRFHELGLGLGVVQTTALVRHGLFGLLLGFQRLCFVQIVTTDRRIGEHRHQTRLNLQQTTGNENKLFFRLIRNLDPHRTRFDPGHQRHVAGQNAEFTRLAEKMGNDEKTMLDAGSKLLGPDIVVAAEKAGLAYGHMGVFHRLVDNHPERGPVFSVANIMKPGSFDMANIRAMETPAIAFFLTLPAPLTALDAWEKMLPTVQRMAELLDGVVLDDSRNALGRQRIAHIREDLRNYDRKQTKWDLRTTR